MSNASAAAIATLGRIGVVPVVTIDDAEQARHVATALASGGLPCMEITLRTGSGLAAIEAARTGRPDVLVGAGTVLDRSAAQRAVDAGAAFVVSPGFDDEVVEWCRSQQVPVIPGVVTPTEMMRALAAGLTTAKFFPAATTGGTATLAAVRSVFPDLRFVPTGGIRPDDLHRYLALDNVLAVGGSWVADRSLVSRREWTEVEARAAAAARRVREIRSSGS